MSTPVYARACADDEEEAKLRKLCTARHAPVDWVVRATIVTMSQSGRSVPEIAVELGWDPRTVRMWIHRFNTEGVGGLGNRGGQGRKPRITQRQRTQIIALVATAPPGRLQHNWSEETLEPTDPDSTIAVWTLDGLAETAQQPGIQVARSQVRRILLAEGIRWRRVRSWAVSRDPEFVPKGQPSSSCTPTRPTTRPWSAPMSSAR
jgi:transposase